MAHGHFNKGDDIVVTTSVLHGKFGTVIGESEDRSEIYLVKMDEKYKNSHITEIHAFNMKKISHRTEGRKIEPGKVVVGDKIRVVHKENSFNQILYLEGRVAEVVKDREKIYLRSQKQTGIMYSSLWDHIDKIILLKEADLHPLNEVELQTKFEFTTKTGSSKILYTKVRDTHWMTETFSLSTGAFLGCTMMTDNQAKEAFTKNEGKLVK